MIIRLVLLGFSAFTTIELWISITFIVLSLLDLWASSIVYVISYFGLSVYVVLYVLRCYFITWNSSVGVDFQIFIYGYFGYFYLSNYFYYFESDGCHILVSERGSVPAPTRDGDFGDLVLFGFKRF